MKLNYKLDVARTLIRGATNRIRAVGSGVPEKPSILEFMITSKCDCRCIMCNIWKKGAHNDLSLDEIETLFSDPVLSDLRTMTLAGGEPFQRDDILDLCRMINSKFVNLIQLYLSSNGLDYVGISDKVKNILRIMTNIKRLRIAVSFDHIGERHDKIRGQRGVHKNALALVERLKSLGDPRLTVQGNFTIAPYNVDDLHEIYDYFKNLGLRIFWFPIMTSDNFFENKEKTEKFSFSPREKKLLKYFVGSLRNQELSMPDYYYYSGLLESLCRETRSFPCSGGSKFLLVNSVGEVYPCYVIPKSYRMGSVREKSLGYIWNSDDAHRIRARICNNRTCDRCIQWYDGYALSHSLRVFSQLVLTHPMRIFKHLIKY